MLSKVWEALPAKVGLAQGTCSVKHLAPIPISKAAGYWISKGPVSGKINVLGASPKRVTPDAVWPDRKPEQFWVARAAITKVITSHGFTAWKFPDIAVNGVNDACFYAQTVHKRVMAWRLNRSILTTDAKLLLTAIKPLTAKTETA